MNSLTWSGDLVTLEEWDSLPEDELQRHVEVVEGVLNLVPSPPVRHQVVSSQLGLQLQKALGDGLMVIPSVEVLLWTDLLTVRVPDLSVVTLDDARSCPRRFRADQVLLMVEVLSPGTIGTDRVMKVADYADAGIPDYWIVDLDGGVTLDAFHLVDGRYEPVLEGAAGRVTLDAPVPVSLDLDALVP